MAYNKDDYARRRETIRAYQNAYYRKRYVKKGANKTVPRAHGELSWNPRISEHPPGYDTFCLHEEDTMRKTGTFHIPSSVDDFDVTYEFTAGSPGTMYNKHGDPGDPPEGPEVEVFSVKLLLPNGTLGDDCYATLSEEDKEALEEAIIDFEGAFDDDDDEEDY